MSRSAIQEHALKVFRQPPERLNCAQAVLHGWHTVSGDTSIAIADFKPLGGGRSPEGLCGALYAACTLAPNHADAIKAAFSVRLGSPYCRALRAASTHPCESCVAQASDLLAVHGSQPEMMKA